MQQGQRRREDDQAIRRVPAAALEARLAGIVCRVAPSQTPDPLDCLIRVEIHEGTLQLLMPVRLLPAVRGRLAEGEQVERDPVDVSRLCLTLPVCMRLRGGRTWILGGAKPETRPDPVLIKALRSAHSMIGRDCSGRPVLDAAPGSPYLRRLVRLAFLAPDLQRAILEGRQPPDLTLGRLMQAPMPILWADQARLLDQLAPE